MRRTVFGLALLALAASFVTCLAQGNPALAQHRAGASSAVTARPGPATSEAATKQRMNQWTVGIAAGLPDGGFVRFASEMARTLDDGDNMRLIPMVTRGATSNIQDLLYLKGVDAAITYADAFDFYSKQAGLSNINDRVRYLMRFFISDIHIYARDEFKTLQDLKGKKVAVGTSGVAAALTGPLIFRRLGIDIQTVPVGGPIALEKLHKGEVDAMVYIAAKPSTLFHNMKPDPGFHFLSVPYTKEFYDFYYPSTIKAEDYPSFLPKGTAVDTIAVPSVLAVYNWKPGTDRAERVNRFVDRLFTNLSRLQQPPFHPAWKDINITAKVPGWQRYPYAQTVIDRLKEQNANASAAPAAPDNSPQYQRFKTFLADQPEAGMSSAQKETLYRQFLNWSKQHPSQ